MNVDLNEPHSMKRGLNASAKCIDPGQAAQFGQTDLG